MPLARSFAVLSLIIIAAGLAMSNLIPSEGESVDPGTTIYDVIQVIMILLMGLGVAFMAWLLLRHLFSKKQASRAARPGGGNSSLGLLLLLIIVAIVLLALPKAFYDSPLYPSEGDSGIGGEEEEPPPSIDGDTSPGSSTGFLLAVFALAAAVFLLLLVKAIGRKQSSLEGAANAREMRAEEVASVSSSIEEIVTAGDVREVILATYRRMLRLQASAGVSPSLTANELAKLLVERRGWPYPPTNALTKLFEEAKYSVHPLGEEHRNEALDSLGKLEVWLKGGEANV